VKRGNEGEKGSADDGDDNNGDDNDGENDDQKINSKSFSAHPRAEKAPEPIPHASGE
jgi:hypothetical protein